MRQELAEDNILLIITRWVCSRQIVGVTLHWLS